MTEYRCHPLYEFPDGRTTWEWVVRGPGGAIGTAFTERQARLFTGMLNNGVLEQGEAMIVIPMQSAELAAEEKARIEYELGLDGEVINQAEGVI